MGNPVSIREVERVGLAGLNPLFPSHSALIWIAAAHAHSLLFMEIRDLCHVCSGSKGCFARQREGEWTVT